MRQYGLFGAKLAGYPLIMKPVPLSQSALVPPPTDSLLAAIVGSSDDAIVSKTLDGIITSWNEGAERIFGYTREEMLGQPVLKLIPPDRANEEPEILERLKRGERVDHFETIRVRKNGEPLPVSLTISPVRNSQGVIVGASKIARDISEARKAAAERERVAEERENLLESERAARMQAEHANRLKDEFVATVSHELRTPLNAILGWAEVLSAPDPSPRDVAQAVEVIMRCAKMQAQLIDDLLDLGRITAGKLLLSVDNVDVAAVIIQAIQAVQFSADAKQIEVTFIRQENHAMLLADAKRLQQIVGNLLTNAIKFTPSKGKVIMTLRRTEEALEIEVRDTGVGITAEFLPRLFDKFAQADPSITRKYGGLGIGLAVVKHLVQLHGGEISAESAGTGKGSMFTVKLPLTEEKGGRTKKPKSVSQTATRDVSGELAGLHVLVVDDDRDCLELVARVLETRKADVTIASSVTEALTLLSTISPDVILSDIGMPGQDGYELLRQIRSQPQTAAIPAAALTALARPEDRTRAMSAGFQTHIAKPVAVAELVAVVQSLAKLHRAAPRSAVHGS